MNKESSPNEVFLKAIPELIITSLFIMLAQELASLQGISEHKLFSKRKEKQKGSQGVILTFDRQYGTGEQKIVLSRDLYIEPLTYDVGEAFSVFLDH